MWCGVVRCGGYLVSGGSLAASAILPSRAEAEARVPRPVECACVEFPISPLGALLCVYYPSNATRGMDQLVALVAREASAQLGTGPGPAWRH